MTNLPPTPLTTLEHAYDIGKQAGLMFIYIGNVPGNKSENTTCYSCGKVIVERFGYQTQIIGLEGSLCKSCGVELNIRSS
jgi:pyruvate formate lyase activating enzyme